MKGYCGISCEKCGCYKATKNNDDLARMKLAVKWSKLFKKTLLPREINCSGCKSEGVQFTNCKTCKIKSQFEGESFKLSG